MQSPKHASSEQMKEALRPIFYDLDERLVAVDDECLDLDVLEMQSRIINLAIAMRNALFSLDQLIEIAKENDVIIVENPPLARALYKNVELDQMVPAQHYKAVAEIISYVFRLKGKLQPSG